MLKHANNIKIWPATATQDNDEDDQDEESPGSHPDDDGHLLKKKIKNIQRKKNTRCCYLRVWTLDSSEGEGDIPLCHASFIDGDTGVVTQVTVVRGRDGEAEVPLYTSCTSQLS